MLAEDHQHAINRALRPWMYPPAPALPEPHRLPADSWEARYDRAYIFARCIRIPSPHLYATVAAFHDFEKVKR